jgi:hypothetical protein
MHIQRCTNGIGRKSFVSSEWNDDRHKARRGIARGAGHGLDRSVTKAVVPPIHMASTYQRDEDNGYRSGRI